MYLFDSGVAPDFSYSTSFDPVTGTTAPQRGGGTFQPTEGRQYEVGVKYQPSGRNSFVTAAAFDITRTNVSPTDPLFTGFSVQTGEVRSRGVEVEAVASLTDGMNLIANHTFLDADITRDNSGNQGNRPALVPRHQGNVWLDYHFQPGSKLEGLGVAGAVRAIGDLYGDNANTLRSPAVTLIDAEIRYDFAEH